MQTSQSFNSLISPHRPPAIVKVEPRSSDSPLSLHSIPLPPTVAQSVSTSQVSSHATRPRSYTTASRSPKRERARPPYPFTRDISLYDSTRDLTIQMANYPWSTSTSEEDANQDHPPTLHRRSSDGEQLHNTYNYSSNFVSSPVTMHNPSQRTDPSSSSITMSTLTGAMGNTGIPSQSHHSGSHSSSRGSPFQTPSQMPTGMVWSSASEHLPQSQPTPFSHDSLNRIQAQASGMSYHNISASPPSAISPSFVPYEDYNNPGFHNTAPESHSPQSTIYNVASPSYADYSLHHHRSPPQPLITSMSSPGPSHGQVANLVQTPSPSGSQYGGPSSVSSQEELEEEVKRLRGRVYELESALQHPRLGDEPPREATSYGPRHSPPQSRAFYASGLPSPMLMPSSPPGFQASRQARTDARIKQFCSLNRAGNALCAWHDPRRERRVYPPRMAPPGYLNCGCTHEEALFEESLARHGVGNYHPGESVRMDPALRNPLLRLLQSRFGYEDGDFERDPQTGDWVPGEGPHFWEAAANTKAHPRRSRGSGDDHP